MTKKIQVKCPTCKSEFNYFDSTFRPFCCERCRLIDLGAWLDESYRVPAKTPVDIEELEAALGIDASEQTSDDDA